MRSGHVEVAFPDDPLALLALQEDVGARRPPSFTPHETAEVGGCFVCFPRGATGAGQAGDPGWAAAALCSGEEVVAIARRTGAAGGPYEPGLLALREGPLLARAVTSLPRMPDVLLVNATGRDHPRRCGLAVHLGWALDLPTAGVTHRPLFGEGEPPLDPARGASSGIHLDGKEVARWVRTAPGARPLAAHAGWRVDLETAVRLVLESSIPGAARTPLPIRAARHAARELRAREE